MGLNNVLPLIQGKTVAKSLLTKYLEYNGKSPDPDTIAFERVRPEQKAAKRQAKLRNPNKIFIRDYQQAMNQLIQDLELNVDSIAGLATPASCVESVNIQNKLQQLTLNNNRPFIAPIGNYSAKVGVILDSEINSLNYFTIIGSGLRVIVLCGLRAQKDVLLSFKRRSPFMPTSQPQSELLGPYQVPLEGSSPHVWFLCDGKDVSRVLITSPESPEISNKRYSTEHLRLFRDAFGLTTGLTGECSFTRSYYTPGLMIFMSAIASRGTRT
jgi:hypothetical protein